MGPWPLLDSPVVIRGFAPPARPWLAGHRGIDVVADIGEPVLSPVSGRIGFVGVVVDRSLVVVEHGPFRTSLEPVVPVVSVGDHVQPGTRLGEVGAGNGHCPDQDCLHWGVRMGEEYLDPRVLNPGADVALVPLTRNP